MNCENAGELMSEYVDGLLERERAAQFRAHLEQCPDCRRELAALEKTVLLVRSLKAVEAPAGMVQGVRERLSARERPRVSLWPVRMVYPALALAAGLVLVLGAVTYFLLEHGRQEAGFTVASVKQKTAEEVVAVKADTAKPAVPAVAREMSRAHSAEKDGRIWSGGDEKMKQEETLVRKEVGMVAADSTAEAGSSDSLAMSAPQAAQASGGALRQEAQVAGVITAGQAAPAEAMPTAKIASKVQITQKGKTFVNLAIITTNRTEVEKVLFAFNGILFIPDEKRFKGGLKPQFKTVPGYEMKSIPAEKCGDVFFITLTASRWNELQDQLKSYGTISLAKHELEKVSGRSGIDTDFGSAAIAESGDQLTVYVTIADP